MKPKLKLLSLNLILCFISISAISANPYILGDKANDSLSIIPQYQTIQVKIGFNLGYDFPYSCGFEFSCLFKELIDANLGCGLGMSGAKIGFGSRIYPLRKKNFSPMAGVYFFYATGLWDMGVGNGNDKATYRITPDYAIQTSLGFRCRFRKGQYFIFGLGYTFPYFGEKAKYISGSKNPDHKKSMDAFATGGISMNIGFLIKLSRGSYLKR
jgi:hypothetical protein